MFGFYDSVLVSGDQKITQGSSQQIIRRVQLYRLWFTIHGGVIKMSNLTILKLTEVASALEAIQAEAQEAFESANAGLTHSERRAGYRTCVIDLQDSISNLQLRTANEIKSLETK